MKGTLIQPHSSRSISHGSTRVILLVVLLVVGLLAVLGISRYVIRKSAEIEVDGAPLPRRKIPAPFIPSEQAVVKVMVETAQIRKEDKVYDMGCGDGRLVIAAALQCGCEGVGVDIDPECIEEANAKAKENNVEDLVRFEQADMFSYDFSEADVVLAYLLPWMLKDLVPQFNKLKPGSRIVTHDFPIEGYEVDKEVEVFVNHDQDRHVVSLYITPLRPSPKKEGPSGPPR